MRLGNFCKKFPNAPSRPFNAYFESANIVRRFFRKDSNRNDPCVVPVRSKVIDKSPPDESRAGSILFTYQV